MAGYDENTRIVPGMIDAEQCVRDSLRAYDRGKRSVVPGRLMPWLMRGDRRAQAGQAPRHRADLPARELGRGSQVHVRVVLERLGDRPVGLRGDAALRTRRLRQRPGERVDHEAVGLLGEREASPSQLAQTTPPAAPEKAARWSASPQLAQLASSGEKPAASASLSRKASAAPRALAAAGSASSRPR